MHVHFVNALATRELPSLVAHRHEVSRTLDSHSKFTSRILEEIGSGKPVSQRSLSSELGIALGLTNILFRQVINKGWVRLVHIKASRVQYLLTPAGIAQKARLSRVYLQDSVKLYAHARTRIGQVWSELSARLETEAGSARPKRVLFVGTSEVAEIGYVCLQDTDLTLVGAIDDAGRNRFLGVPVHTWDDLQSGALDWTTFDYAVVMTFDAQEPARKRLRQVGYPQDRVIWL